MENKDLDIYCLCQEDINKGIDKVGLMKGLLLIILGVALYFVGGKFIPIQGLSMLTLLVGVLAAITGIIVLLVGSKKEVYVKTNSKLKKKDIYLEEGSMLDVVSMFEKGDLKNINNLVGVRHSNLKLTVLTSNDKNFLAVVAEKYVPFNFAPITNVVKLYDGNAADVCSKVECIQIREQKI